jgi:hypothetical protein
MDVNPPNLGTLNIKGNLYFQDFRPVNYLSAKRIWVEGGLIAGNMFKPFNNKIIITLNGS